MEFGIEVDMGSLGDALEEAVDYFSDDMDSLGDAVGNALDEFF